MLIDSRVEVIARARRWLSSNASAEGFAEEEVRKLGLVVSEACANVIEHAYRGQPDKPIELRLAIDESSLVLKIRHVGDVRFAPEEYEPPDLSQPHEDGYGVFLMHSVMDEVLFDTASERGTTLTLVKRCSKPSS